MCRDAVKTGKKVKIFCDQMKSPRSDRNTSKYADVAAEIRKEGRKEG